jgi:glucose-1-phosphate cytidylyltransferase
MIKEYFRNYFLLMSDITVDMRSDTIDVHHRRAEPWKVTIVDTGEATMTGGRLARVASYLGEEPFCFTYGDGVADIDIIQLLKFHREHGKVATLTAVQPPGRYGILGFAEDDKRMVRTFQEKPRGDHAWINGGFFVLNPEALQRIVGGDECVWEKEPLETLAAQGQLAAYRHEGYWRPMDTLRDKRELEDAWATGRAPWKMWN